VIAANGIRLVFDEHRSTTTPTLKSGQPGKTKVSYGETEDAVKWLWKFVDGAKRAGELYGRTLVVFACEHYANQLALPASQRGARCCRTRTTTARARRSRRRPSARCRPATANSHARSNERLAALEEHDRAATGDEASGQPDVDVIDDEANELGDEDLAQPQAA